MSARIKGAMQYGGVVIATLAVSRFFPPAYLLLLLFALYKASAEMRALSAAGESTGYTRQMRVQGAALLLPLLFLLTERSFGLYISDPLHAVLSQESAHRVLLLFLLWQLVSGLSFTFIRLFREGSGAVNSCYLAGAQAFELSLAFFSSAMMLFALPYGFYFLCLAVVTPWVSDSAAWFIGRKLGKRKAFPALSPNKTIAGVAGALLGTALFYYLVSFFLKNNGIGLGVPSFLWILGGVAASVLAQAGDLWESALKRRAGVKDSGDLIPGHGGMLDRIDSSLFLMPVFFFVFLVLR